ncbi:YceI family protein [Paraburkholderia sp. SIMBA_050]|jgi:polyisoprenoid-binding protein YceI|uniref:Polyisoprenoid-binding protein YceI n=2 Tax=Burkholderiaceae TaxID=119060 RepID=A0A1M6KA91_9BURK|nr:MULTISPECIES: YceI family protein [Paraburkholderia]AXE96008.1 YceI family protein [Paraburkholderia terricola]ORC51518.1 polyisoprenoid-binding protein [Burkholderia sp. A27]SDN71262.1 Polyisoprenoid-binding protein YceI [Paraburkholderia sediminicola]SHJ55787.1 Polyisoprenoid-binding protein YceI [Paraburkholderia terricola]
MKTNFSRPFLRPAVAVIAGLSLFGASLAHADVDTSKSSVIATTKQMNVPVDGKFRKFSAQLNFDPAKPTAGSANVSIDTGSYDLGADDYNKQAQGKEWFDSAAYPAATFVSSAIAPAGGNQYKITGKLTIKGKSQTVVVPVTIASQGATQTFDGALPIRRTQFDVGTGEWKDTSVVADEVVIKFHIVASKK